MNNPKKPGLLLEPTNDGRSLAFFTKIAVPGKGKCTDLNDTIKMLKVVSLQLLKKMKQ